MDETTELEQIGSNEESDIPAEPDHRSIRVFWRRVLAFTIDSLFLGLFGFLCGLFLFKFLVHLGPWGRLAGFGIALMYFGVLDSAVGGGQSFGKRVMAIEVVDRMGRHISFWRSALRYSILGIPFFLNGAMIPPAVVMAPVGYAIGFLIFGLGGAIVYLLVFNRRTRQGLHDLATGSFVTRTSPPGEVKGSVWRPHFAIVAVWCLGMIILPISMRGLTRHGVFPDLFRVQRAIQASGNVYTETVFVGKSWSLGEGSKKSTRYFSTNVIWKKKPKDIKAAADKVASIVLENYPGIVDEDTLVVTITYGYDLGISKAWVSRRFSDDPFMWKVLLNKENNKLRHAQPRLRLWDQRLKFNAPKPL